MQNMLEINIHFFFGKASMQTIYLKISVQQVIISNTIGTRVDPIISDNIATFISRSRIVTVMGLTFIKIIVYNADFFS